MTTHTKPQTGGHMARQGIVLALVAMLAIACASMVRRSDDIRFSHKTHVHGSGVACAECHAAVIASDALPAGARPMEKDCLACHEREGHCDQCHVDPKAPKTWNVRPRPTVAFSHQQHLQVTHNACEPCHVGMAEKTSPTQGAPARAHDRCMSCHRKDFRAIDCRSCHPDLAENPTRPVSEFSHDAAFRSRHASLARGDEAVCNHCHRPGDCADCHSRFNVQTLAARQSERVDRDLVHRGDFLTRHAIEAALDPNGCLRCHTNTQCASCHATRRVDPATGDRTSPHPPGWMKSHDADGHGRAARRDIARCAACHDQGADSNCVRCHRVGAFGGNPHPNGFHPRQSRTDKACRACHP